MLRLLSPLIPRVLLGAVLGVGCLVGEFAASGASAAFPNIRHVIHISSDGLGGVYLSNYLAQAPQEFPGFLRLRTQGAGTLNARCDYDVSVTEPNHTSMLTGRPVLQQPESVSFSAPHGMADNYDPGEPYTLHTLGNLEVPYKASTFDVAHDHGLGTAFFAGKEKFDLFVRSYNETHGAPDLVGEDNGTGKIDFSAILDYGGATVFTQQSSNLVTAVTNRLATASPEYTFLHLADLDIAGHYYGWGSATYRTVVRHIDAQLMRIFAAIEAYPELRNRTAIVLTADHGGGDIYGSHIVPSDRRVFTIPLLVWGPGVPVGHDLYDLCSNRAEPGSQYLDYNAPRQPLRNGDSGNLALTLLGLPSIPGSCLLPELRTWLNFEQTATGLVVSWLATGVARDLEKSDLGLSSTWTPVTEGVVLENGRYSYRVNTTPPAQMQVFRLKQTSGGE